MTALVNPMKLFLGMLFLAVLAFGQAPGKPQQQAKKGAPRLGFLETKDNPPLVDTDLFDEQKYIETVGTDTTSVKSKRAAHETALMHEFMEGFSQAKDCDGIVMMSPGDQKPDFGLQIMVDSHDLQGQKPVWVWVLREVRQDKIMPVGNDDSGKQAAAAVCRAVWNVVDPGHLKKSGDRS
jgi:hypothetical protein